MTQRVSPAFERNKEPILEVLREALQKPGLVLEVASGSGQHAAYFSARLPHLRCQPSDLPENMMSIESYRRQSAGGNMLVPVELDLSRRKWPLRAVDYLVCVNAIHIVPWPEVNKLFSNGASILAPGGIFLVYGPYRYRDRPLEPSNLDFDRALRMRDPASGVRYFEDVHLVAQGHRSGVLLHGFRERAQELIDPVPELIAAPGKQVFMTGV